LVFHTIKEKKYFPRDDLLEKLLFIITKEKDVKLTMKTEIHKPLFEETSLKDCNY
jgi:hypothetical protein